MVKIFLCEQNDGKYVRIYDMKRAAEHLSIKVVQQPVSFFTESIHPPGSHPGAV